MCFISGHYEDLLKKSIDVTHWAGPTGIQASVLRREFAASVVNWWNIRTTLIYSA